MSIDLTNGPVTKKMMLFSLPLIAGNLLQQTYNIADTVIVGRFLGADALAAVGSSYTLMTFLTSILLGLCMGSGALFSIRYGEKNEEKLKESIGTSFLMIAAVALLLNVLVCRNTEWILEFLQVPQQVYDGMRTYLEVVFTGIFATFLYNYFASLLRAAGESLIPLIFLAVCAVLNIVLDLWFVIGLDAGIAGAAVATVISQWISGIGIAVYTWGRCPQFRLRKRDFRITKETFGEIFQFSFLTCVQQSVMNLGILMVQGLVNSFGPVVMAAFAAAVKIDSFAYMPAQEFANAFSIFISQNRGAGKEKRVQKGVRSAVTVSAAFCICASVLIYFGARYLMLAFIDGSEHEIIRVGIQYLHIEGAFYCGIGILFLWYGYYRAVGRPEMSVVLTVISLGTRVLLSYTLAPIKSIGVIAIWWSIPIGWFLADVTGYVYLQYMNKKAKMCRN